VFELEVYSNVTSAGIFLEDNLLVIQMTGKYFKG